MFATVAAIIGLTVQGLVARVRSHALGLAARERDLEAMAELSRSTSGRVDARERVCAAACKLSDAYFAVLLETDGDDTLILTVQAGLEFPGPTFTATEQRSWAMLAYAARTAMYIDDPARHPDAGRGSRGGPPGGHPLRAQARHHIASHRVSRGRCGGLRSWRAQGIGKDWRGD